MNISQDAVEILHELCANSPKSFFGKIEAAQRGIGFVLAYLVAADGEVLAGDLARELNVSTARIAALLRTMEKNGLITRRGSADDARRTVVEITSAGVAQAAEIREQILIRIELLLEKVGKDDLKEFIRISKKIKDAFEE